MVQRRSPCAESIFGYGFPIIKMMRTSYKLVASVMLILALSIGCKHSYGPTLGSVTENRISLLQELSDSFKGETVSDRVGWVNDAKGKEGAKAFIYGLNMLTGWVILDEETLTFAAWDENAEAWYIHYQFPYDSITQAEHYKGSFREIDYVNFFAGGEWRMFTASNNNKDSQLYSRLPDYIEVRELEK